MTTYHYDVSIVWQIGLQSYVRGAAGLRSLSLIDSTGAAVTVTQDGASRGYVQASDAGRATFTAEVPSVVADFGSGVMTLYSREAQDNAGDGTLALAHADAAQATANTANTTATNTAAELAARMKSVAIGVEYYGAVGDGSTDDAQAFQDAFDDVAAAGGGTILLGQGKKYLLNDAPRIYSNTWLQGYGSLMTKPASPTRYAMFTTGGSGLAGYGAAAQNLRFSGLTLEMDPTTGAGCALLTAIHTDNILVEQCVFLSCSSTGHILDLGGCRHVTVTDSTFAGKIDNSNNKECIQVDIAGDGAGTYDPGAYDDLPTLDVTVTRCRFIPRTVGGVTYPAPIPLGSHVLPATGTRFADISFTDNYVDGMGASSNVTRGAVHFVAVERLRVTGNTFVAADGVDTAMVGTYGAPVRCRDILVEGNTFVGTPAAGGTTLQFEHTDGVKILNNTGRASAGVGLVDTTNFKVTGNELDAGAGTWASAVSIDATSSSGRVADNIVSGFTQPYALAAGTTDVVAVDQDAHVVGAAGEPAYQNSWAAYSGQTVTYQKLPSGKVSISGWVTGGARATTVFTLPEGYRPPATKNLPVLIKADAGITGKLTVGSTGNLAFAGDDFNGTGTIVWASVDVEFWPAP